MRDNSTQIPVSSGIVDINLRDFVAPLFRRKRLILTTFLIVVVGVIAYFSIFRPGYSSHMDILVNRERLDPLVSTENNTQVVTANDPVTQEEINSEVELMGSRDVLEGVVRENNLQVPQGAGAWLAKVEVWKTDQDRFENTVKALAKQIKISPVKDTNLIEITYKSPNAQRSYNVLKSLSDLYMVKHAAVHRPSGSFEFFATETDKYQAEMKDAEDKLRQFGRANLIAAPDEQRTRLAEQVATSVGELHQAQQQIAGDEERIKSDQRQMGKIPARATTTQASAYNDKLISDLSTTLLAAQTKRAQLAVKYDPSYPLVQEADQEIAQANASLTKAEQTKYVTESTDRDPTYELLREDEAKSEADLAAQRATFSATGQSIRSIQSEMVDLDQLSLSKQDLQRDMRAAESNYLLYLAKREQERTSNALDVTRISNVAIAVPPAIPVLPVFGWPAIVVVGLFAGLVLGCGAAYLFDYFDPTFHTPGEVVDMLGIPVVVAVSRKTA